VADGGGDEALARAAATGCRASFASLVERHYERIYRLAWRWVGSRTEAEDIAQDVCVKLASAIKGFRGDAAFTTWLYRIAFTTATDRLRARQRIIPFAPSDMAMLIEVGGHDHDTETPESKLIGAQLWLAVRALPDQQRDAVLLIYGEDLSHQEAALIMGCSEKTVSWHVHEARKRLKVQLVDAELSREGAAEPHSQGDAKPRVEGVVGS
jgi:RNA polymerase sigma-70 factor, ECF subfamily